MQLHKLKVHAPEVLRIIPDGELARLAKDTLVDYCAKILTGERMFYLLVYAFLCADRLSQRKLESVFASQHFKTLFNYSADMKVTRSSISTRLSSINLDFFERSYELIYGRLSELYTEEEVQRMNLIRIDSTMVAETCNKLKEGFTVGRKAEGREDRKQIKYVLDRGLTALDNYKKIDGCDAVFVGRINTHRKMKVVRSLMNERTDRDLGKLALTDDVIVHLYNIRHEEDPQEFRIVKARFKKPTCTARKSPKGSNRKKAEQEVYFITNITNKPGELQFTAQEIAEAYRRRWDIEVFYRFLKQNLSFSHFLSTNDNGIKVILYMTLITAMLIMIYKRLNDIGYTEAKFCFRLELADWILELNKALSCGNFDHRKAMMTCRNRIP